MSDHPDLRPESRPPSETTGDDELISIGTLENALANVREGLPRGYRMRADRHYVDLLASPAAGQPVRMIPLADIEAPPPHTQPDLRTLIESIRAIGIVQPLLVRRRDSRYELIAGRRRFAAAQALRLAAAPCLVQDVDDQKAAALSIADNVRSDAEPAAAPAPAGADPVQRLVAEHLATISQCTEVTGRGGSALDAAMLNLVRAHAWRAARLIDTLDLAAGTPFPVRRQRALASIVDEVIDGFAPECAANGVVLRAQMRDDVSTSGLNDRELFAALSAAVIAMLPLVERAVRPTIVVKASNTPSGALVLAVSQSDAPVSDRVARAFFDQPDTAMSQPAPGHAAAAAARAVRAVAERHGGSASFDAAASGAVLTITLGRRS